jgi:hypothetical protein
VNVTSELWVKGVLSLVALALVVLRWRRPGGLRPKIAGSALQLMAFVAAMAYFNFGGAHGRGYVHHWEQFHYDLGSKYFPELGYDGLYVASLAAQGESNPQLPPQPFLRDLRTNEVMPTAALREHALAVRQRFSAERWRHFVRDNQTFVEANAPEYLRQIRTDHGYNPTPTWTFTARLFSGWLPLSSGVLPLLAAVDPILLLVLFVVLFRTYGSLVGCLAVILVGLGHPWRFDWVGGAFLRQDWLFAVGIGICALRRERCATAGACLAYATMVRVFPVLFLFGPAVVALRELLRDRRMPRWALRLAGGFAVTVVLCLGAGALTGRGPSAWPEFARNLEKHRATWLTNNVGLKNLLLYGPETVERRLVDWSLPEPWIHWQEKMTRMATERHLWIVLATVTLVALAGVAAWPLPKDAAAVLGVAVVFALLLTTCYYWQMLLLVPILGRERATMGVLALSAALYGIQLRTGSFEAIFGAMSWGLALLFVSWTWPAVVTAWRGRGASPSRAGAS